MAEAAQRHGRRTVGALGLALDDLRPDVAAAIRTVIEAEGGEPIDGRFSVNVAWRPELLTDDSRWVDRHIGDARGRVEYRTLALSHRAAMWLGRWLALDRPRPRLDDAWLDAELAMMALSGEQLQQRHAAYVTWSQLVRPWRAGGSSLRECHVCGAELTGRQRTTCSTRCRVALHRQRQAVTPTE